MEDNTDEIEIEVNEEVEDSQAYISYDIATYPSDFTLSGIVEMWRDDDIIIPNFQREYVWTIKQASLLIESFLLGLPVPPVFFYIDEQNKNLVIDGQQRILSTAFYFDGFFGKESLQGKKQVFRLQGLDVRSPFYRKTFDELDDTYQRKLKSTVLRAINIRQLSPVGEGTSAYHIFERLNTGGTPLKSQEIRNVVFRGDFVDVLRELNTNEYWRRILGNTKLNKHQVDVELVLRLFAFRNGSQDYEKPMKEFLNRAMKTNQSGSTQEVLRFSEKFPRIIQYLIETIGERPFHLRGRLNTSALDSVYTITSKYFNNLPNDYQERFNRLKENTDFHNLTTIGTTDTSAVKERYNLVKQILID